MATTQGISIRHPRLGGWQTSLVCTLEQQSELEPPAHNRGFFRVGLSEMTRRRICLLCQVQHSRLSKTNPITPASFVRAALLGLSRSALASMGIVEVLDTCPLPTAESRGHCLATRATNGCRAHVIPLDRLPSDLVSFPAILRAIGTPQRCFLPQARYSPISTNST
jgi:hypothetical protein